MDAPPLTSAHALQYGLRLIAADSIVNRSASSVSMLASCGLRRPRQACSTNNWTEMLAVSAITLNSQPSLRLVGARLGSVQAGQAAQDGKLGRQIFTVPASSSRPSATPTSMIEVPV